MDTVFELVAGPGYMDIALSIPSSDDDGEAMPSVSVEALEAFLKANGIVYGIDEEALQKLAAPLYDVQMVVARGTPPQDGTDGRIEELFAREPEKKMFQREDGSVDYRKLGLVRDIAAGTAICKVYPPTEGVDGTNAKGEVLKARNGAKASLQPGENTHISQDGTQLEAAVGGNLVYRNGRFCVETVVRVGNIDYETGSIVFSGDVQVNGEMQDGFEIEAGGDVSIHERVGAVRIKGANIILDKGANGKGKGVLEAEKMIRGEFFENCTLLAGEKIEAGSMVNCKVECEGDVEVMSGKGIITGGSVTAFGSIKAREVGNDATHVPTNIVLGVTPRLLREKKQLEDNLAEISSHIEALQKNVQYIEMMVAGGKGIPEERVQMLRRTQLQLPMSEKKKGQLEGKLAELEQRMANVANSALTASVIHPPTKVSIGSLSKTVDATQNACRIYKNSAGELVFGLA